MTRCCRLGNVLRLLSYNIVAAAKNLIVKQPYDGGAILRFHQAEAGCMDGF